MTVPLSYPWQDWLRRLWPPVWSCGLGPSSAGPLTGRIGSNAYPATYSAAGTYRGPARAGRLIGGNTYPRAHPGGRACC